MTASQGVGAVAKKVEGWRSPEQERGGAVAKKVEGWRSPEQERGGAVAKKVEGWRSPEQCICHPRYSPSKGQ
jgi:hypothetical protein